VAQNLAHGLLLPADVSAFVDATDESMGRRLQWHTIAVSPFPSQYYHFPPAQVLIFIYFLLLFFCIRCNFELLCVNNIVLNRLPS